MALTTGSPIIIPTDTDEPAPTDTDEPVATDTDEPEPTNTEVVILPTDVPPPTNTAIVIPAASDTPQDPTPTSEIVTDEPVPVETEEVLPTNTEEAVILPTDPPPPTDTATLVPTATSVPPTNTDIPTATSVPTNTDVPPPTNTPGDPTPTQEGEVGVGEPTALPAVETEDGSPVVEETQDPNGEFVLSPPFLSTITHTVQRGDTVGRLAALYGSDVDVIIDINGLNINGLIFVGQQLIVPVPLPAPMTATPTPTTEVQEPVDNGEGSGGGDVSSTQYTVQTGDTLSRIAVRFNTTVATLIQLNGIANPNLIRVGQVLTVPGATGGSTQPPPSQPVEGNQPPAQQPDDAQSQTYVVQAGDTLYRISLRFGVSMQAVAEANGILNVNRIFAGQVLVIP